MERTLDEIGRSRVGRTALTALIVLVVQMAALGDVTAKPVPSNPCPDKVADLGSKWYRATLPPDLVQVTDLAIDPMRPGRVVVAGTSERSGVENRFLGSVYSSDDGGCNWTDITPPRSAMASTFRGGEARAQRLDLAPSSGGEEVIFLQMCREVDTTQAIVRSADGGKTWTEVLNVPHAQCFSTNLAVAPSDPKHVFLTTSAGFGVLTHAVHASRDGGLNWELVYSSAGDDAMSRVGELPAAGLFSDGSLKGLVVDPTDPTRLWMWDNQVVLRSTDSGKSWSKVLDADSPSHASFVEVDFASRAGAPPSVIVSRWTYQKSVFQVSLDGGESWSFLEHIGVEPGDHVSSPEGLAQGRAPGSFIATTTSSVQRVDPRTGSFVAITPTGIEGSVGEFVCDVARKPTCYARTADAVLLYKGRV